MTKTFKLMCFEPALAQQHKPAAQVATYEAGVLIDKQWLDQDEIAAKAQIYGAHAELLKANEAYNSIGESEVI